MTEERDIVMSVEQNVSKGPLKDVFANLQNDVVLQEVELGQEFLLRVRVVKLEQDLIDIRTIGDKESRVVEAGNRARLVVLAVRNP